MHRKPASAIATGLAVALLACATPAWAQAPALAASRVCADCGVVRSMRLVREEGTASGIGAVAGGSR